MMININIHYNRCNIQTYLKKKLLLYIIDIRYIMSDKLKILEELRVQRYDEAMKDFIKKINNDTTIPFYKKNSVIETEKKLRKKELEQHLTDLTKEVPIVKLRPDTPILKLPKRRKRFKNTL